MEISRPEVLRVLQEFEEDITHNADDEKVKEHPEAAQYAQQKFFRDINALIKTVKDSTVTNPFMENDPELIKLTTGEIMDPAIAASLRHAPQKGRVLYHTFVNDKIDTCENALSDTIPGINIYTLQNHPPVDLNKKRGQAISAKNSTAIVTRFYVNLKDRSESDVNDFFKHEKWIEMNRALGHLCAHIG